MENYSEKVMDHFRNPRNVGVLEDADGVGEVGNPLCGDMMTIYLKIEEQKRLQARAQRREIEARKLYNEAARLLAEKKYREALAKLERLKKEYRDTEVYHRYSESKR